MGCFGRTAADLVVSTVGREPRRKLRLTEGWKSDTERPRSPARSRGGNDYPASRLEAPRLRTARIAAELKHQGWNVGPNRVRRLMREDNLLCVRKRKFVVTTDSGRGRMVCL